jgi:hypothetical protein
MHSTYACDVQEVIPSFSLDIGAMFSLFKTLLHPNIVQWSKDDAHA